MRTIHPDDARLTAYALGELHGSEASEIEAMVAGDPALAAAVDEIRQTAEVLQGELAAEPALRLSESQRGDVEAGAAAARSSVLAFPRRTLWFATGLAAAAMLALALVVPSLSKARDASKEVARQMQQMQSKEPQLAASEAGAALEKQKDQSEEVAPAAPTPATLDVVELRHSTLADANALGAIAGSPVLAPPAAPPAPGAALKPDSARGFDDILTVVTHDRAAPGEAPPATASGSATVVTGGGAAGGGGGGSSPGRPGRTSGEAAAYSPIMTGGGAFDGQTARFRVDGQDQWVSRENYSHFADNPFLKPTEAPLSTFSIDVDTAAYANMRRFIESGSLPPADAVRIEELINYFSYAYEPPSPQGDAPFSANIEINAAPWSPEHRLVRIGLRGRDVPAETRPATSLVFLIDVSGSMQPENKLPLIKLALRLLVEQLHGDDRLAIVTYAGSSGVLMDSIYCTDQNKQGILSAIDRLGAGGSTNGAGGLVMAYDLATRHFIKQGVNRVILCTDGDFNVGVSSEGDLVRLIEEKRTTGVFLSVLGFGEGNLQDAKMKALSKHGNGNYGYIDSLDEARKVLVEQMGGTLVTIAKDVKIQVEFNPATVGSYRLIGYENRLLAVQDFNDDRKDAGEIGAGHTVTALYEIVPAGAAQPGAALPVDELKYQKPAAAKAPAPGQGEKGALELVPSDELLTLKIRYKEPDGEQSRLLEFAASDPGAAPEKASADFRFAASVAQFGMLLRHSPHKGGASFANVLDLATAGLQNDPHDRKAEFIKIVERTRAIAEPAGKGQ